MPYEASDGGSDCLMASRRATCPLLAVVVAAGNPSEETSKAAARKFEGTWQLVSAVTDGKPTPADVVSQIHIVIRDGKADPLHRRHRARSERGDRHSA